jgi:elongation factor 2
MARFKHISELEQLMSRKEAIRNLGIIAHIDHGKTTLADSLLAGVGLLSPSMAGSARVLDYLDEEQKRKITLKTANVGIVYARKSISYLINLVDTPGHVDFTGKVTRAIRTIDGVVVLVDAVEEIMAQTEILTRQAVEQRVRPVLFINKVDRLIEELHLSPDQIEKKLRRIINGLNDLIALYAEEAFRKEWKIEPSKGNVAFGSALHGWGFTLMMAKNENVKFSDVIDAYSESRLGTLSQKFPVHRAVFEMAVTNLPNPRKAQAYRIEKIWDGDPKSRTGEILSKCSDDDFPIMCVTNVQSDPLGGSVVVGRLFSGMIKAGDKLYCLNSQNETTVEKVFVSIGELKQETSRASAGNIAILSVSDVLKTGETLVDLQNKENMVPFENITYISEPVITVAVEPKDPKEIQVLLREMERLVTEDPNLWLSTNRETGEYLLSGMGELHLEITLKQLKEKSNLELVVSSPTVVYRESVTKKGITGYALSPNQENKFAVQVEPEEEANSKKQGSNKQVKIVAIDENRNVLVDCGNISDSLDERTLNAIIAGFEFACKAGPVCGEPMRHVKVNLISISLNYKPELRPDLEVMHGMGKAIFGSFLTAKPIILEPIYKTEVTVATDLAGECSRILETNRGKISSFEQKGMSTIITGQIPVSETFGLSRLLRSATSGSALWQNVFDHWEAVPEKLSSKIITEVRKRKGLPTNVPPVSKFLVPG